MQPNWLLSVDEWRQLLRQEAARTWGEQRIQALEAMLERTAVALYQANYPLPLEEEEPYLLAAQPFPYEELG